MNVALRVADATTGAALVVAGALMWRRRPTNRVGILAVVAGVLWFAGSLWPAAAFVHRGALVHLYIAFPTGRLVHRRNRVVVVLAYLASISPLVGHDRLLVVTWAVIASAMIVSYTCTSGVARRAASSSLAAAVTLAGCVMLAATSRILDWRSDRPLLWLYLVAVIVSTIVMTTDFSRSNWSGSVVTNLVRDLGTDDQTDTLECAISGALGDPTMQIAYRLQGTDRFVDDLGREVDVTGTDSGRSVTPIRDGSELIAYLVHDTAVLDDPALMAAVSECTRLAVSNARMQAAARERVAALDASRRRIVEAGHVQRQRFEDELAEGVERRLAAVTVHLRDARCRSTAPLAALLDDLDSELLGVQSDLADLSAGIHPRLLAQGGLDSALAGLAARVTIPTEVRVTGDAVPPVVEATVYFVCAEALTNVVKHAVASRASIVVEVDEHCVRATISDDGVGGADFSRGTGLRGLADRVEALGGRLSVESADSRGTRVRAVVPIEDAQRPSPAGAN